MLNPLHPYRDHNSNLVLRLIPYLESNIKLYTLNDCFDTSSLPKDIDGIPIKLIKKYEKIENALSGLLMHRLGERYAFELVYSMKIFLRFLFTPKKNTIFFSEFQRFHCAYGVSLFRKKYPRVLYMLDPTDALFDLTSSYENEWKYHISMLKNQDIIFTTRFIKDAMLKKGYDSFVKRIVEVSFPMVTGFPYTANKIDDGKITLLFCGRLYAAFRSPEYFLKIVSMLDKRFKVIFMGPGCKAVINSFSVNTEAEIVVLGAQEYNVAQQAMADADILINIGNSVPVHMPSKTLEYINTGKPFVNFYKLDDCPTLYYTKRYPLCLNFSEKNEDIDTVAKEFIDFCVQSKGKQLSQDWIFENFKECTPQYIAKQITDACAEL